MGIITYASLARLGFPKSYSGKILLVVFAGHYLLLAALVLYLLVRWPRDFSVVPREATRAGR